MSFKTILVHCADENRFAGLLAPSVELARRFEAHIACLSVVPPVLVQPALVPGGVATIIDSHRKPYERSSVRMKTAFQETLRTSGISGEWVDADAQHGQVWHKVLEYGRAADLIIASEPDRHWAYSEMMEAPEEYVLYSGRPVLFIPNAGSHTGLGQRPLVAWNGRREAARAAHDALPILKTASDVDVVWVNPDDDPSAGNVAGADLCTVLARHGVVCKASAMGQRQSSTGEALLDRARETGRDLLVMGCYGHSRLRELVLGGATRHVLRNMTVPVLMAH